VLRISDFRFKKEAISLEKKIIQTGRAPAAIGPYVQAVRTGPWVFVSGQIPIDPETGTVIRGDIRAQTRQALKNLDAILQAAGTSLDRVVKTTLYITNMDDFSQVNEAYAPFFPSQPPARACVQVARLPKDVEIEIEAVALL
jgi:2-iminobutanoate/2-iminopropanoate deaminase